jgi:paraquat-inducible protein B
MDDAMKTKASAFLAGLFVLVGLALGIGATLIVGSGRLFRERVPFVLFFEGSVSGLQEGAPVTFKGVQVGTVTKVAVAISGDGQLRIPVYIELDPASIRAEGGHSAAATYVEVNGLVEQGLRAQLRLQSLLTGILMVQLDFFPAEPPRLVGGDLTVPELPTKQSGLQRLSESMQQIKVDEIAARMLNALEGIDRIVNSRQTRDGIADTAAMLRDLRETVAEIRSRVEPAAAQLSETNAALRDLAEQVRGRVETLSVSVEAAATETQRLAAEVNRAVTSLTPKVEQGIDSATQFVEHTGAQWDLEKGPAADLVKNLTQASTTAERAIQQTAATVEAAVGPESRLQAELQAMLVEVHDAARSLRVLTDYLQRHPEALVRGKAGEKEDDR